MKLRRKNGFGKHEKESSSLMKAYWDLLVSLGSLRGKKATLWIFQWFLSEKIDIILVTVSEHLEGIERAKEVEARLAIGMPEDEPFIESLLLSSVSSDLPCIPRLQEFMENVDFTKERLLITKWFNKTTKDNEAIFMQIPLSTIKKELQVFSKLI